MQPAHMLIKLRLLVHVILLAATACFSLLGLQLFGMAIRACACDDQIAGLMAVLGVLYFIRLECQAVGRAWRAVMGRAA